MVLYRLCGRLVIRAGIPGQVRFLGNLLIITCKSQKILQIENVADPDQDNHHYGIKFKQKLTQTSNYCMLQSNEMKQLAYHMGDRVVSLISDWCQTNTFIWKTSRLSRMVNETTHECTYCPEDNRIFPLRFLCTYLSAWICSNLYSYFWLGFIQVFFSSIQIVYFWYICRLIC